MSLKILRVLIGLLFLQPLCAAERAVTDDDGVVVRLPQTVQRIVSLSPGATAVLYAAGAGNLLVGTADYSNEPEAAKQLPRIGDSQSFDLERILALHPDVVVVWSGGMGAAQIERLRRVGLRVYHHRVTRLDDLPPAVRRLGALAGTQASAARAAAELEQRIGQLRAQHRGASRGSVLIQVWDRPIYTVGGTQLLNDAIEACGYRNLYADLGAAGPPVGLESVLARNPDVILAVAPDRKSALAWLDRWRAYATLKAVRTGRLYALTDQRLSRLGPGAVDATVALCDSLEMPP